MEKEMKIQNPDSVINSASKDIFITPVEALGRNWQKELENLEKDCSNFTIQNISHAASLSPADIKINNISTKFLDCRDIKTTKYEFQIGVVFGNKNLLLSTLLPKSKKRRTTP